jgi:hypothetical protein
MVMTIKEIKAALETPGTIFKAPNSIGEIVEFRCHGDIKFDAEKDDFVPTGTVGSIYKNDTGVKGMNVTKFGPTCVTLYTFDMMSKKSVAKIRYADVEIITHGGTTAETLERARQS